PAAGGASIKKAPKPRNPRKRRVSKGESASPAAAGKAQVAGGDEATAAAQETTAVEGEEGSQAKTTPKPRKPRKRRNSHGESSSSSAVEKAPPVDNKASAAAGAAKKQTEEAEQAEKVERVPAVKIPADRKESFQRARRAAVAQKVEEAGGVLRESGSSGEASSQFFSEEGSESGGDAPFPYQEARAPPYTWQDPDTPARPKELSSGGGRSSEGGESGAAVDAEGKDSKASPSEGKPPRRRAQQRKKPAPPHESHPVLGHFVADLGYKRVYVTSIESLVKASVWEKARTLHPVHSAEIYKAKKLEAQRLEVRRIKDGKKPTENLLTKKNQQYVLGIVDGQHRLGALLMLAEEGMWDPAERNVVVEVFDVSDDRGIEEIFEEVNR
ncbi:unnamed protein product, partial [Hapterophycus canaliculatus]